MEKDPLVSVNSPDAATHSLEDQPLAEILDTPESHEILVQDFVDDAGETAVEATVELVEETSSADGDHLLDGMDYTTIDRDIDSLIESGANPEDIFDQLGPLVYSNRNVGKLLDAGLNPMKAIDFLNKGGVNVTGSSVIAGNLDAFIRSGVGVGVIAHQLEPGYLSASFDKLYAAGLDLHAVDELIADGKLKPEDVQKRRDERARGLQDEEYGVDHVLDLATGKMIQATRPDHEAAA